MGGRVEVSWVLSKVADPDRFDPYPDQEKSGYESRFDLQEKPDRN